MSLNSATNVTKRNIPKVSKMANIEEKVETLLRKTIENLGYELYDVIYEKEAQDYYLRIFIDKQEGIDLNDCEKVNDAISDMLDEANYIKDQYFLEVSSPGIERLLRKDKHLEANIEKEIELKLYKPIDLGQNEAISKSKLKDSQNIETKQEQSQNKEKNKSKSKKEEKKKKILSKEVNGILKKFNENAIIIEIKNNQLLEIDRKNISVMKLKYNWE